MTAQRVNLLLFKGVAILLLLIGLEVIGYTAMWLSSRQTDFLSNKNYFRIRDMLMDNKDAEHLPRYLSLPYLGYIPYPGYAKGGIVQHNKDGYRGNRISRQLNSKLRILCMGGSTTYGLGVNSPSQTYPARLEKQLSWHIEQDSVLNAHYTGVEVLNAGLEAGNSAEELQQYIFKYSYYRPHVVVVNSGVNDALLAANASADFQPDYTHYRRINFHIEPLPLPARWMMRSCFFSYLAIRLFYSDFSGRQDEFAHQKNVLFPHWANMNPDSILEKKEYENYPFYKNSRILYEQIIKDGALLLVIPNVLNQNSEFVRQNDKYRNLAVINELLSKTLAEQAGGKVVPFTFDSIKNSSCWIDDCHLNAEGEANKAAILFRVVVRVLHGQINLKKQKGLQAEHQNNSN